jgi:DNA-binding CsgD family transcriptional regulator
MVECSAGNLLAAAERADLAYDLALQAGSLGEASLAEGVRALVQAQLGRADEARAAAAAAFELVARSGWQVADFWARVAIGQLELSLGNWSAVVATLSGSLGQVEKKGVVDANRRPLPDAIEALIQLGEVERADRLTLLLERRAQELEQGAASLAAARCRALVQAARGELAGALDGLEQALAEPDVREPLTFARALIVKGQLERRRKRKRQAAQSLREALQICERIGTTLWAARAAAELERLGRVDDPDELTATEARVARLAASGLTNREVATAAFMSQKTVEANMSRIFRKLGIRSRSQLATRLAARERTGDEAVDADTQLFGASTTPVEQDGSGD